MQIRRDKEPKNKEFFNRVSPIVPYLVLAAFIFQLISAITEAFGIWQFGNALGSPDLINLFFTILIVIGWELLIRVSVQYLSRTGAQKFRKEIKLEKMEGILIVLALSIGGPLIYYSYSVSKENAHMTFQFMMPERDTTGTAHIDHSKKLDLSGINNDYESRKSEIVKRYKDKENASRGVYSAAKAKANTNIEEWRSKEKKYSKKYTSQIKKEKDLINNAYAEYKKDVKEITDFKDNELANLSNWRSELENSTLALVGDNIQEENTRHETFKLWFNKYSFIWSHFAGLTAILAVLLLIFVTIFKVLAGIEEETHVTPESLEPGLIAEIGYLIQLKITSPIRNRVRKQINSTASKRVPLEIVTPVTLHVTPESIPPPVTHGRSETVTHPLRSSTVTPVTPVAERAKSVTESVTEKRYAPVMKGRNSELPTHVTPVTGVTVTDSKASALRKSELVTQTEAVVVELEPTVTGDKPKKTKPAVTDTVMKTIMVGPTKAVITDCDGNKETVTLQQVQSRKRSNFGNIKKRKSKAAKGNCRRLYEFYSDLEKEMKAVKK